MGGHIVDVRRRQTRAGECGAHRPGRALGARRQRGKMIRIGRRAVAAHLGIDARPALHCLPVFLEHKDHRALREHEPVPVLVVGPRGPLGRVVARREGPHLREGPDGQRRHGGLGASRDHHVDIAPRNGRRGLADRVAARGAGRGHAHVRSAEIEQQAHLPGEQVGRDLDDEEGRDFPVAARLPGVVHRLHLGQAAQADPKVHAHPVGVQGRAVRIEPGIGVGLDRSGRAEVGESAEFLHVLLRHRLRQWLGRRPARMQHRGQRPGRIEVLHLSGDLRGAACGIEPRDAAEAAAAGDERGPGLGSGIAAGRDGAEAGDDDTTGGSGRRVVHGEEAKVFRSMRREEASSASLRAESFIARAKISAPTSELMSWVTRSRFSPESRARRSASHSRSR